MLLTNYLFNEVKTIWDEYLNHPFIKEMGEGKLDKDKKEKLREIFIKASIYKMKFWDMAYEEVKLC